MNCCGCEWNQIKLEEVSWCEFMMKKEMASITRERERESAQERKKGNAELLPWNRNTKNLRVP